MQQYSIGWFKMNLDEYRKIAYRLNRHECTHTLPLYLPCSTKHDKRDCGLDMTRQIVLPLPRALKKTARIEPICVRQYSIPRLTVTATTSGEWEVLYHSILHIMMITLE